MDTIVRTVKSHRAVKVPALFTGDAEPDTNVRVVKNAEPEVDPLAAEIGARISEAMRLSNIGTQAQLQNITGLHDKTLRRYLEGSHVPKLENIVLIADACRVTLDWLVRGLDPIPSAYFLWIETGRGRDATDEERRVLRELPTKGYMATLDYYDRALDALRLRMALSPDDIARTARGVVR